MQTRLQLLADIEDTRERFFADPTGFRAEKVLSGRLDETVRDCWRETAPVAGCGVLAIGGYGRATLHPYSDLDLLLFFEDQVGEKLAASLLKPLWDLSFRLGHQIRQTSDFNSFDTGQIESYTAFMDARFLWGDSSAADRFMGRLLPQFLDRHAAPIQRELIATKARRWARSNGIMFLLEPDVKEAPGGLRDYQWCRWISRLIGSEWNPEFEDAAAFLHCIRNYLHFMAGRDHNALTYEYQERIAEELGYQDSERGKAAEHLMRDYFLKAEFIADRVRALSEKIGGRSDCLVVTDSLTDPKSVLEVFAEAHQRKSNLDAPTLERIRNAMSGFDPEEFATGENGRTVLAMMKDRKGIYNVLLAMHRVGVLGGVFPEFEEIRCRVIRDFFHKYTVDQHSLIAVRNIEQIGEGETTDTPRGLATILKELNRPELLLLATLLHDVGKASRHPGGDHACTSVEVVEGVLERLQLSLADQERVRAAVRNHLEMSKAIMRRDIGDPEVVEQFAELVGTQEDLRMLCLLTYADMKAVSPEVWTSWKGDLLFRLYVETFNDLRQKFAADRYSRDRIRDAEQIQLPRLLPPDVDPALLDEFLEGFPTQFLRGPASEKLAAYFAAYLKYSDADPVVIDWFPREDLWEVFVITRDSPLLFSRITGALASFGMNTVRAQAFSNRRGIVFDVISFEDPGKRLETNPSEVEELERLLSDAILGRVVLERLIQRRSSSIIHRSNAPAIPVSVHFDPGPGARTIMEIVANDDVGLLFHVTRAIGSLKCDVEVALISTEGRRVFDVFYLRRNGEPLTDALQGQLRDRIEEALNA